MNELFKQCLRYKITPNQLFLLHFFKNKTSPPLINIEEELKACKEMKLITYENKLSDQAEIILTDCESLFKKSKSKPTSEVLGDNYKEKVKAYRELFPIGQHQSLGYTFRSSVEDLTPRFIWFFTKYRDFSWELVLKATDLYIQKSQETGYKWLGKANYFIQKTDKDSNTVTSRLADLCQDLLDGNEQPTMQDFYVTYEERNL
jgi:hypothetical protein